MKLSYHTSYMFHLNLRTYKFKNNANSLVLWIICQSLRATIVNIILIHMSIARILWNIKKKKEIDVQHY